MSVVAVTESVPDLSVSQQAEGSARNPMTDFAAERVFVQAAPAVMITTRLVALAARNKTATAAFSVNMFRV